MHKLNGDTAFRTQGLTKTYGEGAAAVHALRGVDIAIPTGEMVVLLGPSGSGKSTLINQTLYPLAATALNNASTLKAAPYKSVEGMDHFDKSELPDNIPALYYAYHMMVGLGTIFIGILSLSAFLLWRKRLMINQAVLWVIMLLFPFGYIANITGWYVAELGRQPYLVYGLLRTSEGISPTVSSGNTLFTLLGFVGLYVLLGLLFLLLVGKAIYHGPKPVKH